MSGPRNLRWKGLGQRRSKASQKKRRAFVVERARAKEKCITRRRTLFITGSIAKHATHCLARRGGVKRISGMKKPVMF